MKWQLKLSQDDCEVMLVRESNSLFYIENDELWCYPGSQESGFGTVEDSSM